MSKKNVAHQYLHPTSVARELRGTNDIRITRDAVLRACSLSERMLSQLGVESARLAQLSKVKTVKHRFVMSVLETMGDQKLIVAAESALGDAQSTKKSNQRASIAKASVRKAFSEKISGFSISENTCVILSAITQAYLNDLGEKAMVFAEAAKKQTIKKDYIEKAAKICE